jgi:hypothetical protein
MPNVNNISRSRVATLPRQNEAEIVMLGGCLCGAIRYRFTIPPKMSVNCHCSKCRRHSGAAFLTYVAVDLSGFQIERGQPVGYRSSNEAVRSHCGSCGSPLTFIFDTDPGTVWVTGGTLDDPNDVAPSENWFVQEKLEWTSLEQTLKAWPGAPGI